MFLRTKVGIDRVVESSVVELRLVDFVWLFLVDFLSFAFLR